MDVKSQRVHLENIRDEMKFMHKRSIVWFLVKNKFKCYVIYDAWFSRYIWLFSEALFVTMINSVLLDVLKTHSAHQVSAVIRWSWNTHTMNTVTCSYTFGACYSRAAWKYVLCYPGWHHPDVNVFQRLEQHLCGTESVTYIEHMNANRPWTVQTPTNEDTIVADVERKSWIKSRDTVRELGLF
jgi:hypothetical protein